jgi:hypothetical protein
MVAFYKKDFTTLEEKEQYGRPEISVLQPGTYDLVIHRVEHFKNKAGTGHVLSIIFAVSEQGAEHNPRFAKEYINYPHSNDTTEWHGRKQLRALTDVVGGFHHHCQIEGKRVSTRISISDGDRPRNQFEFISPQQHDAPPAAAPAPGDRAFWS